MHIPQPTPGDNVGTPATILSSGGRGRHDGEQGRRVMTLVRPPGTDPDDARRALQSPEPQAVEEAQPQAVEEQEAARGEPASAGWMRPLITKVGAFAACLGAAAGGVAVGRHHPPALLITLGLLVLLGLVTVLLLIVGGFVYSQTLFARKGASEPETSAHMATLMKASAAAFTHPWAALIRVQTAADVYPAEQDAPDARQEAAEPAVGELREERDGAELPGPRPGGDGSAA